MEFKKTVLTNKGAELLGYVLNGQKIEFTKMILSAARLNENQLKLEEVENLRINATNYNIQKTLVDVNTIYLNAEFDNAIHNSYLNQGFSIGCVGLWAKTTSSEDVLFAIAATYPEDKNYMPSYNEKPFKLNVEIKLSLGAATLKEVYIEADDSYKDLYTQLVSRTIQEANIPEGADLGAYAYAGCTHLIKATLPHNIEVIPGYMFKDCENLVMSELPEGTTEIGVSAFENCKQLALKTLPRNMVKLNNNAFKNSGVTIDTIPESVCSIGAGTFSGCDGITELTFEMDPEEISETAFSGCKNLKVIRVPWDEDKVENAPWGATNADIIYGYY